MNDYETVAIAKAIKAAAMKAASGNLEPSEDEVPVDITVRFVGWIKKGFNYWRTPTASIPILDALALTVHDAGITGQAAVNAIMRGMTRAITQDEEAKTILKGMRENLASAEAKIREGLAELPQVEVQGPCTGKVEMTVIERVAV
jgi:hypothetical protein